MLILFKKQPKIGKDKNYFSKSLWEERYDLLFEVKGVVYEGRCDLVAEAKKEDLAHTFSICDSLTSDLLEKSLFLSRFLFLGN